MEAETVVTGAGMARRPWRISGGKTSSMAGFLSPAERETVERVGVGCEGRAGPGVGVELSTSNPNDDPRQTDAGEPGRDGDDHGTLIGAEPCTPASSKVPSSLAISSPSSERCFVAILARGKTLPDRPDPVVDLGLVASLFLRAHLALEATQCVVDVNLVLVLAQGIDQRVHLPLLNGVSQYAFHNTRYRARAPRVGRARTRLILRRKFHRWHAIAIPVHELEISSQWQATRQPPQSRGWHGPL